MMTKQERRLIGGYTLVLGLVTVVVGVVCAISGTSGAALALGFVGGLFAGWGTLYLDPPEGFWGSGDER